MAGTFPGPAYTTQIFLKQNVTSTAGLISGITALMLDVNRINTAWVTVATNDARYRWDGVSPTTTQGHLLPAGQGLRFNGKKTILALRFIGAAGAASDIAITLYNSADGGGIV